MSFSIGSGAGTPARVVLASCFGLFGTIATAQSITGTATYGERIALPPAAVFEATLEDVSRADAPAETIARTSIPSPGNPPIAFTIAYDPARILANRRYSVRARILLDGRLLFSSDTAAPVITGGSPTRVSVLMRRVAAGQNAPLAGAQAALPAASPRLEGTSWRLVKFQGSDGTTLTPDDRSKYTIELGAGGQLTARVDCNRGRGTWKSSGPSQLQFGPLALTRAQCPPGSLHDHIVKQWGFIRSYVVEDGRLFLSLMADGGIYEFEPVVPAKATAPTAQTTARGPRIIHVSSTAPDTNAQLAALVTEVRQQADAFVFLSGGASKMREDHQRQLLAMFDALSLVTKAGHRIAVGDGGTRAGIMEAAGLARRSSGGAFPLIGVAPAAEIPPRGKTPVDPNHSHIVAVDNPAAAVADAWGSETGTMYWLFARLAESRPSVTIVANGGGITLAEVDANVQAGRRMILIEGSGRAAAALVSLVKHTTPSDAEVQALRGRANEAGLMQRPELFSIVPLKAGATGLRDAILSAIVARE